MVDKTNWKDEIDNYFRISKTWRDTTRNIVNIYRSEAAMGVPETSDKFDQPINILWSNIQTVRPSIFSRMPKLLAHRRHKDRDPIGRVAASIVERAVNQDIERNGFHDATDATVLDFLLGGRGTPWLRFEVDEMQMEHPVSELEDGNYMTEAGETIDKKQVKTRDKRPVFVETFFANRRVIMDYVHWEDFAHSSHQTWAEVVESGWVARRALMSRDAGVARFGSKFLQAKADKTPASQRESDQARSESSDTKTGDKCAAVWEIWDTKTRKQIFFSNGVGEDGILESRDDPYRLSGFFPTPRPAFATLTNENLFPASDYTQYRRLAIELQTITQRIHSITRMLRVTGLYDKNAEGIGTLLESSSDGKMLPVSNMASLLAKSSGMDSSLGGVVQFLPLKTFVEALAVLYQAREQTKKMLYEVSGLSDILRGSVDHREKATQSKLKSQFASHRIEMRRRVIERMINEALKIQAEIMLELYTDADLRELSGFDYMNDMAQLKDQQRQSVFDQAIELLRNDRMRSIRLDVETDSMMELDATMEAQKRNEFLKSAGSFLQQSLPLIQAHPPAMMLVSELLLFVVRGHRAGRNIEMSFEQFTEQLKAQLQKQRQQKQRPDPKQQAEMMQARMKGQEMKLKLMQLQMKVKADQARDDIRLRQAEQSAQVDARKGAIDLERQIDELKTEIEKNDLEIAIAQEKYAAQVEQAQAQQQRNRQLAAASRET